MVLYRPRLTFLRYFSGAMLPNFHMIVKREFLIMWGQQLVDVFSIVGTNLLTWLITYIKSGGTDVKTSMLRLGDFRFGRGTPEYSGQKSLSQRRFVRHKSLPYFRTAGRLVNKLKNSGLIWDRLAVGICHEKQRSLSIDRDLNPGPPEYEIQVLVLGGDVLWMIVLFCYHCRYQKELDSSQFIRRRNVKTLVTCWTQKL